MKTYALDKISEWPQPLRIIVYYVIFGLIVGLFQTTYWIFISNQFYPILKLQGFYNSILCIMLAMLIYYALKGMRKMFTAIALLTFAINSFVTLYFLSVAFIKIAISLVTPSTRIGTWIEILGLYLGWNFICFFISMLILYYLIKNEINFQTN